MARARLGLVLWLAATGASCGGEVDDGPGPWLILNGRLVPGPHEVEIRDGAIHVDGEPMIRPRPPGPRIEVTPQAIARFEVGQHVLSAADAWITEFGREGAQKRAVEWLRSQSIVESAEPADHGVLVTWKERGPDGRIETEGIHFGCGFGEELPEEKHANLEREAERLRNQLRMPGLLIIATDGNVNTMGPGAERLAEIRRAVSEGWTVESRARRLEEILHHAPAARAIAERVPDG